MAEKFADKVGQIPPRYVGVATQIALGTSAIFSTPSAGSTVIFIDSQFHISPVTTGLIFIVAGVIAGITRNKWVYWFVGVSFFLLYGVIAFWAAINNKVPYPAGVLYLAVAAYSFLTFPREERA